MRRWLAILLLVLLPTQLSWAVVADYCAHETGAGADHVGHHDHDVHAHAPAPMGDVDPAADTGPSGDIDCGHCHGHCTGLPVAGTGAPLDGPRTTPAPAGNAPCAAAVAAPPERPQWARLA
ncbi:hypothetical protein [Piscinibacter sakaiensis]|uniref:Cobalt-zinc-cadmium resistance protein czcI n=1 Tax=Piscinibacter sakaiensis TaxID=1547922 RepID=A0A0K8P9A5_PISS1|nr:hypothetical protein [Piscinibacter sakaiensis]GAP38765.1 cobalt-zinc-cadmium resistance protein czcI precursor [Piscinibacter sakaiensis]